MKHIITNLKQSDLLHPAFPQNQITNWVSHLPCQLKVVTLYPVTKMVCHYHFQHCLIFECLFLFLLIKHIFIDELHITFFFFTIQYNIGFRNKRTAYINPFPTIIFAGVLRRVGILTRCLCRNRYLINRPYLSVKTQLILIWAFQKFQLVVFPFQYFVSFQLSKWFQRRSILKHFPHRVQC